jgi:hypothetical protein
MRAAHTRHAADTRHWATAAGLGRFPASISSTPDSIIRSFKSSVSVRGTSRRYPSQTDTMWTSSRPFINSSNHAELPAPLFEKSRCGLHKLHVIRQEPLAVFDGHLSRPDRPFLICRRGLRDRAGFFNLPSNSEPRSVSDFTRAVQCSPISWISLNRSVCMARIASTRCVPALPRLANEFGAADVVRFSAEACYPPSLANPT